MAIDLTIDAAKYLTDFGETITYRPADGRPRRITAVVERNDAETDPGAGQTRRPDITISVLNNDLDGISAGELDTGRDHVELARREGADQEIRPLGEIITQDEGILTLRVR